MNEFYEKISNLKNTNENIVCTILSGKNAGGHALFEDGKLIVKDAEDFFGKYDISADGGTTALIEWNGCLVFREKLGSRKKMVICGGGFVSMPVIRIAKMIGFYVTVLEDRPVFADHARAAGADEVICDSFSSALEKISGDRDSYFVIVTRGHRYDMECLESMLKKPYAYIGMMGSKLRVQKAKEVLLENGFDRIALDQLHAPIGLSISAETPEEIGVSIMAEIIQVKNQDKTGISYPKEILSALKDPGKKVLVTIIERKGSAPRAVGTKMLVMEDGRAVGTIGGGCAEAEITGKALLMIRENQSDCRIEGIDMTGREAEDDGMVCGGTIRVFLEPIDIE